MNSYERLLCTECLVYFSMMCSYGLCVARIQLSFLGENRSICKTLCHTDCQNCSEHVPKLCRKKY